MWENENGRIPGERFKLRGSSNKGRHVEQGFGTVQVLGNWKQEPQKQTPKPKPEIRRHLLRAFPDIAIFHVGLPGMKGVADLVGCGVRTTDLGQGCCRSKDSQALGRPLRDVGLVISTSYSKQGFWIPGYLLVTSPSRAKPPTAEAEGSQNSEVLEFSRS